MIDVEELVSAVSIDRFVDYLQTHQAFDESISALVEATRVFSSIPSFRTKS